METNIFRTCSCIILIIAATTAKATPPSIHYRLRVNAADTSGYYVEMQLQNVPHHFRLAMATHHEYDDRFWRFVRDFQVSVADGKATLSRFDSAVYDISIPGDAAVISYRIQLPKHNYAHQPFLSSHGGLFGDIHSFYYLVGQTQVPSTISFDLPQGWELASGLDPTAESNTFIASSAGSLMDCPVLAGRLHRWKFSHEGISYTIAYLPAADILTFDTTLLVANIKKIVAQTVNLFGGVPYKHYTFQLVDGVYGALEHGNSVTIGAPAAWLTRSMQEIYEQLAHEFSHTWNLVNIRPGDYTDLNYGPQERSAELWFSEGMAMFYADLLVRRAGLPVEDSTRITHLETLIGRYYADTGNSVIPQATVSLASNASPDQLGDYAGSSIHLQGELLGAMLDLLIRRSTDNLHSFDDVMRLMYTRFGGKAGFHSRDIEQAVTDVCGSDKVHPFFEKYIYEGHALDFDPWLGLIGLRLQLSWRPNTDSKGRPAPDTRAYVWQPPGDSAFHFVMTDPRSCWVKAGLHTGDVIVSIDGLSIKDRRSFYERMNALKIGDAVLVRVRRPSGIQEVSVKITGYEVPVAHLLPAPDADSRSRDLLRKWQERLK